MKGKSVRVVRGRKVALGTVGYVFWSGVDAWNNVRVGIKDAAGAVHWTAAKNCEVVEGPETAPFVPAPGFFKGAKVTTAHGPAIVFWVGEDKRAAGETRVGVKLVGSGMTFFCGAGECETSAPPVRVPTTTTKAPVFEDEGEPESFGGASGSEPPPPAPEKPAPVKVKAPKPGAEYIDADGTVRKGKAA